jgi:hypothetical protein
MAIGALSELRLLLSLLRHLAAMEGGGRAASPSELAARGRGGMPCCLNLSRHALLPQLVATHAMCHLSTMLL